MSDTPPINPAIGELFRQYRKKKINPSTGKSWILQELSQELSSLIQRAYTDGNEEGLSASAISRLENGSLLPSRTKLKILADFLDIPETDLKPLIDLGENRLPVQPLTDHRDQNRMREFENKLQKTPFEWLQLLSAANMAGFYYKALSWAEDCLLVVESPQIAPGQQAVLRALIQSKKAYAQFCLEADKETYLQRSLEWARNANQALDLLPTEQIEPWELAYLRIEVVRSLTTASMEIFNHRFLLNPRFEPDEQTELKNSYAELQAIFTQFEQNLHLTEIPFTTEQKQLLLELYLYLQREKDRLGFKWLEVMEMHAFWHSSFNLTATQAPSNFEAIATLMYQALIQEPDATTKKLDKLYQEKQEQLYFSPAPELQSYWQQLSQSMLNTLDQHDQLDDPNPNKAYQEAVMLFPITAARLGQFDRFIDLGYFKLIYMQTNAQTRPVWYYVRAYCYALYYRLKHNPDYLDLSLQNWFRYCYGDAETQTYNEDFFGHCLGEVALWSTWFPLIHDKKLQKKYPSMAWFVKALHQLMNLPRYKKWRGKRA